jgi:hypothetical protein
MRNQVSQIRPIDSSPHSILGANSEIRPRDLRFTKPAVRLINTVENPIKPGNQSLPNRRKPTQNGTQNVPITSQGSWVHELVSVACSELGLAALLWLVGELIVGSLP